MHRGALNLKRLHVSHWRSLLATTVIGTVAVLSQADGQPTQRKPTSAKTAKDTAIEFCRVQSMARMKYATIKWLDAAREERPGVWLVSGVRTAKGPAGNVDQQYTCRISTTGGRTRLELLQIFKEASKTGKDVFYVAR